MKKFRLPRKTKKALSKIMFLYPPDKDGNSLMASPKRCQEDFDAVRSGIAKRFPENVKYKKDKFLKLDEEIFVDDTTLKKYVDDIFRKDLRLKYYHLLLRAKTHPKATIAYFNFVNAYQIYRDENDAYSNICCLAIDKVRDLLNKK